MTFCKLYNKVNLFFKNYIYMFEDVIPTYTLTSKFANLFLHFDGWTIFFKKIFDL